jgi:putative Holliday junction resolvase
LNREPQKLVGLDVGDKRVGVAVADVDSGLAFPYAVHPRAAGRAEKEILALLGSLGCSCVIVGLPLSEGGEKNEQCLKVERFCERLKKRAQLDVYYVDEYASSAEAEDLLRARGRTLQGNAGKGLVDAASAAIILQRYIDQISSKNKKIES